MKEEGKKHEAGESSAKENAEEAVMNKMSKRKMGKKKMMGESQAKEYSEGKAS